MKVGPIVLAFSGGLDTSAILIWLKEHYDRDIIAYCANLGNCEDTAHIESRAMELGATKFICDDLQSELVTDYIWPVLKSGATYQKDYLLGTALARPLIAKRLIEIAKQYDASAIAHGATGKGNDQLRFEKTWSLLLPDLEIIAAWKKWDFTGRGDLLAYLSKHGFNYDFPNKTFSIDENLFHASYEGGPLEDLDVDAYEVLDLSPKKTNKCQIKMRFQQGILASVTIDGHKTDVTANPVSGIEQLNTVGIDYAIGIQDLVEERINGIKSRGVYITPGGTIIKYALEQLKQIAWDTTSFAIAQNLAQTYGEGIYAGDWFSPAQSAMTSFFDNLAQSLTGEVVLEVSPHFLHTKSRCAVASLYDKSIVSFESDEFGINEASDGYCKTLNFKSKQQGKAMSILSKGGV